MSTRGGLRKGRILMTVLAIALLFACYLTPGVDGGNRCSERKMQEMKDIMMGSNCGGRCNRYFRCQAGYNAVSGCRGQGRLQASAAYFTSRTKAYNNGWINLDKDSGYRADWMGRNGHNCEGLYDAGCTYNQGTRKC